MPVREGAGSKGDASALAATGKDRSTALAKSVQDEIFDENIAIMRNMAKFAELDPESEYDGPIPQSFMDACDGDGAEARKMYRIALAGWKPMKEAPVALLQASKIVMGILKAKALEGQALRPLNAVIVLGAPVLKGDDKTEYPTLVVEAKNE